MKIPAIGKLGSQYKKLGVASFVSFSSWWTDQLHF
jgi:hypothetical protein